MKHWHARLILVDKWKTIILGLIMSWMVVEDKELSKSKSEPCNLSWEAQESAVLKLGYNSPTCLIITWKIKKQSYNQDAWMNGKINSNFKMHVRKLNSFLFEEETSFPLAIRYIHGEEFNHWTWYIVLHDATAFHLYPFIFLMQWISKQLYMCTCGLQRFASSLPFKESLCDLS